MSVGPDTVDVLARLVASLDDDQRKDLRTVLLDQCLTLGSQQRAERDAAPNPNEGPLNESDRIDFYWALGVSAGLDDARVALHRLVDEVST